MQAELKDIRLEGMETTIESYIRSRPSESEPFLISAVFECLRQNAPMNEAEILGRCRRIRYSERARR